ncbi:MAG: HNH endonuclease [Bryobacteraceae bacterium]
MHGEILAAVGLERHGEPAPAVEPFRSSVLEAYDYACALCGHDVRLGKAALGLGAAHIRWRPAGGPDEVSNGIALCAIHHRAFDRGALTLDTTCRIEVSPWLSGTNGLWEMFTSLNGRRARLPKDAARAPTHLLWHHKNVFWSRDIPGTRAAGAGA